MESFIQETWHITYCYSPSLQGNQKSDTSRNAFDYAGYESVLQILLSVKVGYQIGS